MHSASIVRIMGDYLDMNQNQIAEQMGVTPGYISHVLKTPGNGFSIDTLEHLSKNSGVPVYIIVMLGYPDVLKKFLGDGADPDLEKAMPTKLRVAVRAELMKFKKSLDR